MEDRTNHGLYLEMTDDQLDRVESRARSLSTEIGVARVTWWRNAKRDRTDLPRALDEFDHLIAAEVDSQFVPNGSGLHFVRTGRPGQGTLSGRPTIGLSLVLISPEDESQSGALRDWADFVHLRHIAEASVPGYTMITPYVNAREGGHPRFLHWYEMDCEDPEQAFRMMTPMVTARLGGRHHASWKEWAFGPSLRIMYVNSFTRLGEIVR